MKISANDQEPQRETQIFAGDLISKVSFALTLTVIFSREYFRYYH